MFSLISKQTRKCQDNILRPVLFYQTEKYSRTPSELLKFPSLTELGSSHYFMCIFNSIKFVVGLLFIHGVAVLEDNFCMERQSSACENCMTTLRGLSCTSHYLFSWIFYACCPQSLENRLYMAA